MKTKSTQKNIPMEWQEIGVGKIFDFLRTYAISRENLISGTLNDKGIGNVHYGDLHATYNASNIDLTHISVPLVKDENFLPKKEDLLKNGDLIMADVSEDYAGIGVTVSIHGLENKKVVGGLHTFVLRDVHNKTDERYRQYLFRNPEIRNKLQKIASGVSVYGISKNNLSKVLLPLPPLPEQNRIVSVLETWDRAVETLGRKIENKKTIKKGLMQKLLTGAVRLPGFTEKWKPYVFEDVASLRKEFIDPKRCDKEKFCVELEHIQSETGKLIGGSNTTESTSLKAQFYPGDILFGKLRAYLRKFWMANREGVCSTEIWVLRANKKTIIPEILFQIVQFDSFISAATMSQGTHMPRSNWGTVSEYELSLPSIEEQTVIANILTTADTEITALETKLTLLKDQKKYLLNNLITGTIRTPQNI